MKLSNILINMSEEARECAAFFEFKGGDVKKEMKVLAAFSEFSRYEGIAAYLDGLDVERLRACLKRSAEARLRFLQLKNKSGVSCYVDAAEALKPFFDAVVSGEMELARALAAASPREWQEGEEYEEDFCYAQFLFVAFFEADSTAALEMLLERYKNALPAGGDIRLKLCQAYLERDPDAFVDALDLFIYQWGEDFRAREKRIAGMDEAFYTERYLSLEGLAWMRLGSGVGLCELKEMPLMPLEIWGRANG